MSISKRQKAELQSRGWTTCSLKNIFSFWEMFEKENQEFRDLLEPL